MWNVWYKRINECIYKQMTRILILNLWTRKTIFSVQRNIPLHTFDWLCYELKLPSSSGRPLDIQRMCYSPNNIWEYPTGYPTGYLLDVEYLWSLDVLYKDIVRMIKLYLVWTMIVASAVAYLQNIIYQFFLYFSLPYPWISIGYYSGCQIAPSVRPVVSREWSLLLGLTCFWKKLRLSKQ